LVSLPIFSRMRDSELEQVVNVVKEAIVRNKKNISIKIS